MLKMGCPTRNHHPRQKCLLCKGLVLISSLLALGILSTFQLSAFSSSDIGFGDFLKATTGINFGPRINVQRRELEGDVAALGGGVEIGGDGTEGLAGGGLPMVEMRRLSKRQADDTATGKDGDAGATQEDVPVEDEGDTKGGDVASGAGSPTTASATVTKEPPPPTTTSPHSKTTQQTKTNTTPETGGNNSSGDDNQGDKPVNQTTTPSPHSASAAPNEGKKDGDSETSSKNATTTANPAIPTTTTKVAAPTTTMNLTTTTTLPPTTTTVIPEYQINQVCNVSLDVRANFGENVSLEDVRDILFIPKVLNKLIDTCPVGSWCLADDYELATDNVNDIFSFCSLSTCMVDNIPELNLNDERRMTLATLMLLCSAGQRNISETCLVAIRKMTHVTRALMKQKESNVEVCDSEEKWANCTGACRSFSIGLYCMCGVCDHQMDMFTEYGSWQPFFTSGDMMESECGLGNTTDCSLMEYSDASWMAQLFRRISNLDKLTGASAGVIVGVVAAVLVTIAGIVLVSVLCVKKGGPRRILGYSRDRVEYTTVSSEEEFD